MLAYLVLILLILVFFHIWFNYNRKARLLRKVPGPKLAFIIGNAIDIIIPRGQLFQFMRNSGKTWGTIWRLWSYPFGAVSIFHPNDIEIVLSGVKHNKKSIFYNFLKPWLHEGLLVSDETAMGTQLNKDSSGKSYQGAIHGLGDLIVYRITRTYLYTNFTYYLSAAGRLEKNYLKIIHNFTTKVINFRKSFLNIHGNSVNDIIDNDDEAVCSKPAMLDLLISAEKKGLIDTIGIQEEVDTFMFEGYDTTSCGLTYLLVILANDKIIQDKIVDELKEIFGDTKRSATVEDLSKMRYLERCIKESMRLYPPVPLIGRMLSEDVNLGGYVIPSGTYCVVHIYDLHRCEDLYKDPLVFDPDRFLPENSALRHPYAFIPFSAGPRNCIGQKFAMLEMKSVISQILRKFVLLPNTKVEALEFTVDLVLRTAQPVYVTFAKRLDNF